MPDLLITVIIVGTLLAITLWPKKTPAQVVADYESLKRERSRLLAQLQQAKREQWEDVGLQSVERQLADVDRRLCLYQD
jgi:hypothetical protein